METLTKPYDQKQQKKRIKIRDYLHSKFLFLPETDISYLTNELIPRLSLGKPVLVIEWSDIGLQLASNRANAPQNAANCKMNLINILTSPLYNGIDPTGHGNIFIFSSNPNFSACRDNLPQWSLSLGMIAATIVDLEPPVTPVGIAQVIRKTKRVLLDVTLESFFEIR